LLDVWQLFEEKTKDQPNGVDALLLDGMHPSDKGHVLIADALTQLISNHHQAGAGADAGLDLRKGRIIQDSLWIASAAKEILGLKMGPFIRLSNGSILTVDTTNSYISNDEGKHGSPTLFLRTHPNF